MAIDASHVLELIEVMENFMTKRRPPENIRSKFDLSYKIEDQSIIIFEIRPRWDNPEEIMEFPVAKTTFVKAKNHWKVFWQKADLKWHGYEPKLVVKSIQEFVKLVDEDKHHCFWG